MMRIAVAGCGVIARHYRQALAESQTLSLVAVTDPQEMCTGRDAYEGIPFYTDAAEMVREEKPDLVLVATPSTTHYEVTRRMLERGVSVLVEKPMAETYAQVKELFDLANASQVQLQCMLHWTQADEVVFLKEYVAEHGMTSIAVNIHDNYTVLDEEGVRHIKGSRVGLGGAWADSGINVLSYLAELLPMKDVRLLSEEHETDDACGFDYYVSRHYIMDGVDVQITVDWRVDDRRKTSKIAGEFGELAVQHNEQRVIRHDLQGKQIIFESPTQDRLGSHYTNYLRNFMWNPAEREHTLALHRILTDTEE